MLEANCPKCGWRMPFAPELIGLEVFCLGCGSHFVVQDPAATPGQPPSSPGGTTPEEHYPRPPPRKASE